MTHSKITDLALMLFRKGISKTDASALRYALHVLENSWYRPKAIAHKDFPYWRMVKYTDDGCSIYQCLNCKKDWEGREAPGWLDGYKEVDEDDESAIRGRMVEGKQTYYRRRSIPLYKVTWQYCPHCCIEWHGPIRTDDDNERMLGPRRKRIQDVVNKHYETHTYSNDPSSYWVIEKKSPCTGSWLSVTKFVGRAAYALTRLKNPQPTLANYKYRLRIVNTRTKENRELLKSIY